MAKYKFKPDVKGFNQAMKLPEVGQHLKREGAALAADAGEGFEAVLDTRHPWLDRVFVQPATPAAHRRNAKHQLLVKALGRRLG